MVRIERLVIVLMGIALLRAWWKLYKGKVKRWLTRAKDHLPRHWRPKSPDDCPLCLAEAQTESPVETPASPVAYPARKSPRGRKKQLDTNGFACPKKPVCTLVKRMPAAMRLSDTGKSVKTRLSNACDVPLARPPSAVGKAHRYIM